MPTLLDDRLFDPVDETLVEEFDLERLARLSADPPAIEPPRFELLEPRFRWRRTLVTGCLAALIVCGLATLRPAASSALGPTNTCSVAD